MKDYWTVAQGNVFDGIKLIGLFKTSSEAVAFATGMLSDSDAESWVIAHIESTKFDSV